MNKVISIHLCGVAFQLEENGYDALRAYLEKAERQLGTNPDKSEIIADIERAIADKFRALLSSGRNVVLSAEVEAVIKEMGPVTDNSAEENSSQKTEPHSNASTGPDAGPQPPKRLYLLKDGAMISGVCNGLAAYIGIDVTLLRLVVAILVFFSFGTVAVAYLVAMIIIPTAETPGEKAAATGPAPNAQEFIRRAREGYYQGLKTFGDRDARRAWTRKFKSEMRGWERRLRHEYRWGWQRRVPPVPPVPPVSPMAGVASMPPPEGAHVMLPLLATMKAILLFFCVLAILSLCTSGTVLGVALPGNLPMWAGIVLVVFAYKILVAPIKAIRRNYYYRLNGWPGTCGPFTEFWLSILPFAVLALGIWMADCFIPGFHHALQNFPSFCHHIGESVQQWWNQTNPPR
ncbi:MAG: PspC domain-containing protein [Nibricoccus sp.]